MQMSVDYFSAYSHTKHTFKNESCHGGKRSKDRITLFYGQIWTQKDAITGSQTTDSSRYFRYVESLPCTYTTVHGYLVLFMEFLICLERRRTAKNRKCCS
jgi:hypothetical protein